MATAASQVQSRVTVVAPRTRVDVALPLDLTVGELMPAMLDMVGERADSGLDHDGWGLSFDDGVPLDSSRTLRSLDVLDGTLLRIVPRGIATLPPVYDDVIDAIATTVRERHDRRPLRSLTGATLAGTALVLAGLVLFYRAHQTGNALIAMGAVAAIIAAAAGVARSGERLLGGTLATIGGAYAVVTGLVLIPGGYGWPGLLLGFLLGAVHGLCVIPLVRTAVVPLTAIATSCLIGAAGALAGVLLPTSPTQVAAGTAAAAVALLTLLPWAVVRLAQLPMPLVPGSADELVDTDDGLLVSEAQRRAANAVAYHTGMVMGCALAATVSCAVLIGADSVPSRVLAAVVVATLLMRVRHLDHRTAKLSLVILPLAGAAAGLASAVVYHADNATLPLFAGLVVAGIAAVTVTVLPQAHVNPMIVRSLDLLDSLLIVAVVPLAAWAMDLYSLVRHL